jgi:3-polyprenyl-4-hydroxybenzoate decarboxylase and related decarboxylases
LGGNRAFIGIAPNHHLAQLARAAAGRGETLPIAVTIGNHPAVLTAAALYLGLGDDELEVAGALLGEPIEVVRCQTSALQVPAHCEIVLEGTLDAGELIEEGPVSEFHGLYETYGKGQVVTFQRMTRRRDAIYQAIQPGYHPEHVLIGGIAIAPASPAISGAVSPPASRRRGSGRCRPAPCRGQPPRAAAGRCAQGDVRDLGRGQSDQAGDRGRRRHRIGDPLQVEWAVATRMKADRDLVVVRGCGPTGPSRWSGTG